MYGILVHSSYLTRLCEPIFSLFSTLYFPYFYSSSSAMMIIAYFACENTHPPLMMV